MRQPKQITSKGALKLADRTQSWFDRILSYDEHFVGFREPGKILLHRTERTVNFLCEVDIHTGEESALFLGDAPIVGLSVDAASGILLYATDPENRETLALHRHTRRPGAVARPIPCDDSTLTVGPMITLDGRRYLSVERFCGAGFELLAVAVEEPEVRFLARATNRLRLLSHHKAGDLLLSESRDGVNGDLVRAGQKGIQRTLLPKSRLVSAEFIAGTDAVLAVSDLGDERIAAWRIEPSGKRERLFEPAEGELDHFVPAPTEDLACAVTFSGLRHRLSLCRAGRIESDLPLPGPAMLSRPSWSPCGSFLAMTINQPFVGKRAGLYDLKRNRWIRAPAPNSTRCLIGSTFLDTGGGAIELGSYLPAANGNRAIPVMISAHGGPAARFDFSSCPEIECFVEFGFGVIAPNFRGSTGYGRAFLEADDGRTRLNAYRDWLDTIDALPRLLGSPRGPLVQMGASYGSFLALNGSIDRPTSAAISLYGIANFPTFLEQTAEWRRIERQCEYGRLDKDRRFLERISPLRRIRQLDAPLLLSHGTHDVRVSVDQSRAVVAARSRSRYPTHYSEVEGEGHGYRSAMHRKAFIAMMRRFVSRHVM